MILHTPIVNETRLVNEPSINFKRGRFVDLWDVVTVMIAVRYMRTKPISGSRIGYCRSTPSGRPLFTLGQPRYYKIMILEAT